jgi:hypothetical protein
MKNWTNRDRVALVIAVGLVSWGLVAIICVAWRNKSFTEGGGEILSLIAGSLGSALTAYFVTRNNGKKPTNDSHDESYK